MKADCINLLDMGEDKDNIYSDLDIRERIHIGKQLS